MTPEQYLSYLEKQAKNPDSYCSQKSDTQRKLASIQEISKIEPIPNAEKLELAHILGWLVVVQKGEFKEGDKVVYLEIDSFIPDTRYEFEFLRSRCFKEFPDGRRGFRIKTIRLRGQISQGLVMPIKILPKDTYTVGQNVSELLGVTKYEPPLPKCLSGKAKGHVPSFIIKTDETRVQLLQSVLDRHIGLQCFITEKIDGSSVTYFIKDDEFGVCSRNLELKLDDEDNQKGNAFVKWALENKVEEKLRDISNLLTPCRNIAIQGELYGPNICGNHLMQSTINVRFFNAFNIDKCQYYDLVTFKTIIKSLGFETVPILSENFKLINDIPEIMKLSVGKSKICPEVQREGIVIRPVKEVMDLGMSAYNFSTARLSFKAVSPVYLVEVEE